MGGMEMETHHIAAFLSVFVTVWYREVHMYTLILLATECTTPFINFRWLLEKMVGLHASSSSTETIDGRPPAP